MLDPAVVPGFLLAVLLVAVAPGPDNAYIVAVSLSRGSRAGLVSAAGMAVGMAVHATAAALGLAVLLRSAPWVLTAVRLGGAGYLGWLAVDTGRTLRRRAGADPAVVPAGRLLLRRAVLTNLTNPKVILFFAAFLPQFVRLGYGPPALQLLTLGVLFLLVGLLVDSGVGLAAGRAGRAVDASGRAGAVLGLAAALTYATLAVLLVAGVIADLG